MQFSRFARSPNGVLKGYLKKLDVFMYFVRTDVMNSLNFSASQFYWNSNFEYMLSNESIICYYSSSFFMLSLFYQIMWITLSRPSTSQLSTKNVYLYYRWCLVLVLIFLFYFRSKTNLECYNWDVIFLSLNSKDGENTKKAQSYLV